MTAFLSGALAAIVFVIALVLAVIAGFGLIAIRIAALVLAAVVTIGILAFVIGFVYLLCKYWKVTLTAIISLWILGMLSYATSNMKYQPHEQYNTNYPMTDGFMK